MKCSKCDKSLLEYSNGELVESDRELVSSHINNCVPCNKKLVAYSETKRVLGCLSEKPDMTGLSEKVMPRIKTLNGKLSARPLNKPGTLWGVNWKYLAVGAATVAALTVVTLVVPSIVKPNKSKLAANIALASPIVQAAFGGIPMTEVTIQSVTPSDGHAVVVLRRGDSCMVIASVDISARVVTQSMTVNGPFNGV